MWLLPEPSPPWLEGVERDVQPLGAAQESPFLSHRCYHRWRWAFQAGKPSYFTSAQESHLLSHFHIVWIQHRAKTGFVCFYLFCVKKRITFVIFQNCFDYFFHSLNKNAYDFKKVLFFFPVICANTTVFSASTLGTWGFSCLLADTVGRLHIKERQNWSGPEHFGWPPGLRGIQFIHQETE